MKFTDTSIRALRPNQGRYERFETGKPGFGVRVSEQGRKTWIFLYRFQGRPRRLTLGVYTSGTAHGEPVVMSLAKAHAAWARARELLANGQDPGADAISTREAARSAPTMDVLAKEYLERHAKPKKRSWREDERILDTYVLPKWKHRKAVDVTKRDVVLLLDDIAANGAPGRPERERAPAPVMANRVRALLSRLFRFAVARHVVENSPVFGVEKPADEHERTRRLTEDEIRTFWARADDKQTGLSKTFVIALKILLVTAQRKGELAAAQWQDIDFESAMWTIPDAIAKNKQTHRVPLSPLALELFGQLNTITGGASEEDAQEAERCSTGPVLPSRLATGGTISANALDRALRRALDSVASPGSPLASMASFTPHDLRRTAATQMGELGFDDFTIGLVLNHKSRGITGRYNLAQYEPQKRRALDAWAARLRDLNEAEASNVLSLKPQRARARGTAKNAALAKATHA